MTPTVRPRCCAAMLLFQLLLFFVAVAASEDVPEGNGIDGCLKGDDTDECTAFQQEDDDEILQGDEGTEISEEVLWDDYDPEQCQRLADKGRCNEDPSLMLHHCSRTCLLHTEDLLAYGYYKRNISDEVKEECEDTYWSELGDTCEEDAADSERKPCIYDPESMAECAKTCMYCMPTGFEQVEFDIGVPQVLGEDDTLIDATISVLDETLRYMSEQVMRDDKYSLVRRACRNEYELCSYWAAQGFCSNEEDRYDELEMLVTCGPACQSCEMQDLRVQCPIPEDAVNILKEGDLNRLFERIVETSADKNNSYEVTVHSRPDPHPSTSNDTIIGGPWVVSIRNFLTDEECDHLIEMGRQRGYEQSRLQAEKAEDPEDYDPENLAYRTSTNTWCEDECYTHPVSRRVIQKIVDLTGVPDSHSEYLQLLKYEPNQFYLNHHDGTHTDKWLPQGPRIITVFAYLNNVEEGGETSLTKLKEGQPPLIVQPERGKALIWPSVLNDKPDTIDSRTFHSALQVIKGHKYGANSWLRLRDYKNAPTCFY